MGIGFGAALLPFSEGAFVDALFAGEDDAGANVTARATAETKCDGRAEFARGDADGRRRGRSKPAPLRMQNQRRGRTAGGAKRQTRPYDGNGRGNGDGGDEVRRPRGVRAWGRQRRASRARRLLRNRIAIDPAPLRMQNQRRGRRANPALPYNGKSTATSGA